MSTLIYENTQAGMREFAQMVAWLQEAGADFSVSQSGTAYTINIGEESK